jgi:hypothetical protein
MIAEMGSGVKLKIERATCRVCFSPKYVSCKAGTVVRFQACCFHLLAFAGDSGAFPERFLFPIAAFGLCLFPEG